MTQTKRVTKFNLWWHMQRKMLKLIFVNVASLALVIFVQIKVLEFDLPEAERWIMWAIILDSIALLIFSVPYIVIVAKAKKKKTFVDMQQKICISNGRKIRYQSYKYTQSLTQKLFGLCTIKFKNSVESMTVKDVSIEAVRRLEQF